MRSVLRFIVISDSRMMISNSLWSLRLEEIAGTHNRQNVKAMIALPLRGIAL
jgi:hypothetical protein